MVKSEELSSRFKISGERCRAVIKSVVFCTLMAHPHMGGNGKTCRAVVEFELCSKPGKQQEREARSIGAIPDLRTNAPIPEHL